MGRSIDKSDLIYIEAGISAQKLASMIPISPKIKKFLSANVSFIYSKSLDDCFIVGSLGTNASTTPITGSISFIHLTDEIKQLQQQLKQEKDEKMKNNLRQTIDKKTREVIKDIALELNSIIGAGAKSMILKDGQKISGFGVGVNLGAGRSFDKAFHLRSMKESAQEQYENHKKGEGGIDW